MIIENKDGSVTTTGVKEANSFTINDSSAQMVIDSLINLYSDPIGSLVREIVSNAVDANRERDLKVKGEIPLEEGVDDLKYFAKDKPQVEVSYVDGNSLLGIDHSITIQDFGNGLSPDRVKKVFTVFGTSTKRATDSLIGGFGIGCKVPFSYTDTFYVRATHNGVARLYMLYKGNALPSMDLVSEAPSDDKNNTIITIPLKDRYEVQQFEKKIESQLKFFTNVVYKGFPTITAFSPEIEYESEHIILPSSCKPNELSAIIGRVVYPINFGLLKDAHGKIAQGYLRFKIGELDLVPSRENLRYTEKTVEAIKAKLAIVKVDSLAAIQDRLDNITDLAEHYVSTNQLQDYSSGHYYNSPSNENGAIDALGYLARYSPKKIVLTGYNTNMYKCLNEYIKLTYDMRKPTTNHRQNRVNNFTMVETYASDVLRALHADKEVYYVEGKYSGGKNAKLYDDNSKDFLVFKHGDASLDEKVGHNNYHNKTSILEADLLECSAQLQKYIMAHPNLKKYEDVDGSNYSENSSGVVREQGVYPFRELFKKRGSEFEYKQEEADIQDLKDAEETIIYGSNEHDAKLRMAYQVLGRITSIGKSRHYDLDRLNKYRILKVNQQLAKKLKNHVHVNDFFMKKYPEVKHFYTSIKLESFNMGTVKNIYDNVKDALPDDFKTMFEEVDTYYRGYNRHSSSYYGFNKDQQTEFLSFIEDHSDLKEDVQIKRLA